MATLPIFNCISVYPNKGYNVKPNNTFFRYSLRFYDVASKSLVLPGASDVTGSRKNYKLFTPRLSPHTPVWADQIKKCSFLCQYSTNWEIYCINWLQLPSTLTGHPHEKWQIFPLIQCLLLLLASYLPPAAVRSADTCIIIGVTSQKHWM